MIIILGRICLKGLIKNTRKALGFFIKLAAILSIIMLMYGVFLFVSYKKAVAPAVTDPQFSAVDSVYLSMPAKGTQLAYAPVPVSPDTRSWIDLMPDKTGEASKEKPGLIENAGSGLKIAGKEISLKNLELIYAVMQKFDGKKDGNLLNSSKQDGNASELQVLNMAIQKQNKEIEEIEEGMK
jgi:hypothetical protein